MLQRLTSLEWATPALLEQRQDDVHQTPWEKRQNLRHFLEEHQDLRPVVAVQVWQLEAASADGARVICEDFLK